MAICGPKLSLCCLILSVWGIIQLAFMGVFFYFHAVALTEDLFYVQVKEGMTLEEFYKDVDEGYKQNAYTCWITAGLYIITLALSGHQFWSNSRSSSRV